MSAIARASRQVAVDLVGEWRQDRVTGLAAEIAFFGVLSFFPGLLATAAALGSLETLVGSDAATTARREVLGFLSTVLSPQADETLAAVRQLFTKERIGTLTLGLVLALWAVSRGFAAVIRALDIAYDLEERRGYVQTRVTALALALGTVAVGSFLLVALALGPLLGTGRQVAELVGLGHGFAVLWDWLRWPFALAVLVLWTTVVFHYAPFHRTPWRWDLPGALLTSGAWLGLTGGLRLYLSLAQGTNPVFGTLGGALILILWLYLLAVGLLLGGELNGLLVARYDVRQDPGRPWSLGRRLIERIRRDHGTRS